MKLKIQGEKVLIVVPLFGNFSSESRHGISINTFPPSLSWFPVMYPTPLFIALTWCLVIGFSCSLLSFTMFLPAIGVTYPSLSTYPISQPILPLRANPNTTIAHGAKVWGLIRLTMIPLLPLNSFSICICTLHLDAWPNIDSLYSLKRKNCLN